MFPRAVRVAKRLFGRSARPKAALSIIRRPITSRLLLVHRRSSALKWTNLRRRRFCNAPNPNNGTVANTEEAIKKAKLRFAVTFIYIPVLTSLGICVWFRERILNYFVQEIFQRRETFLISCFPKRIIIIRHGQSQANVDHHVLEDVPDDKIKLTRYVSLYFYVHLLQWMRTLIFCEFDHFDVFWYY